MSTLADYWAARDADAPPPALDPDACWRLRPAVLRPVSEASLVYLSAKPFTSEAAARAALARLPMTVLPRMPAGAVDVELVSPGGTIETHVTIAPADLVHVGVTYPAELAALRASWATEPKACVNCKGEGRRRLIERRFAKARWVPCKKCGGTGKVTLL